MDAWLPAACRLAGAATDEHYRFHAMWALHNCLSRAADCWKAISAQAQQQAHGKQHPQQQQLQEAAGEGGGEADVQLLPPWLLPAQRDAVADVLSACSDEVLQHTVVQVRRDNPTAPPAASCSIFALPAVACSPCGKGRCLAASKTRQQGMPPALHDAWHVVAATG
jgi:hypothetical protein